MRLRRVTCALACLLAGALVTGCGDSDSDTASTAVAESQPAPPKSDFPATEGRSLGEIVKSADKSAELVVSPAALAFHRGKNRYPFGVFYPDRRQYPDAELALYIAKVPAARGGGKGVGGNGKERKGGLARARTEALDAPAVGPFPAAIESLRTKPAYRAKTTSDDPDAATVVYDVELDFPSDGEWRIAALVKQGDEMAATLLPSANVGQFKAVPEVGEKAPKISTPTAADFGGDASKVTTRVPPDTQNRVDYADVIGKKPIILLFATPQFCQSRVCGPVVDVAEQVKDEYGDKAEFIHMEIFEDNDPNNDVRPQVRAFGLPTEPWLFAIDRNGRVSAVAEGAFGVDLLTQMTRKVTAE